MIEYDLVTESERPEYRDFVIRTWGNIDPVYHWYRNRSWEKHSPMVARRNGTIVGFHAAMFNQVTYIYTIFIAVAPDMRRRRVAEGLLDYSLHCRLRTDVHTRMKFKCGKNKNGNEFYRSLGAVPYAEDADQFWYDMPIGGARTLEELIAVWKDPQLDTIPHAEKVRAWTANARILI